MPQIGRTTLLWLGVWLAVVPVALARAGLLAESDTFWEISTGKLIFRDHRIPSTDPFSWTAYGQSWRPNSWGFDVLLWPAYRLGGLTAVAVFGALLVMAVVAAMLLLARHLGAGPVATGVPLLLAAPLLIAWFSVRPQLADYIVVPLLVILVDLAVQGPVKRRAIAVAGIAVLHLVWVNLHASATLGIALTGAAGVTTLAERLHAERLRTRGRRADEPATDPPTSTDRPAANLGNADQPGTTDQPAGPLRALGVAALPVVAAIVGTLPNPAGWEVIVQGWAVHNASTDLIVEWRRWSPADAVQTLTLAVGVLALATALAKRYWRLATILAVLAVGGILVVRFQPILAVCAVPVLGTALDRPALRRWAHQRRLLLGGALAALVVAYGVLAVQALPHLGRPAYPVRSVRALPTGCRLANSYDLGGLVILLREDVPVSIDSRNDLYGRNLAIRFKHLVEKPTDGAAQLADLDVECVLVPGTSGLAKQLVGNPGWHRIVDNRGGAVFVRADWS
jgi:hypothetical protein